MPREEAINPYWLGRRWAVMKDRFEDIHGREVAFGPILTPMEEQAGYVASRHPDLLSSDFEQGYMLAGLHIVMSLEPDLMYRFEGFPGPVRMLTERVLATCHPDFNPEVAMLAKRLWKSDEDREQHFMLCGAAVRRLAASARFWSHEGSHAYVDFVMDFLTKMKWDPNVDRIRVVVGGLGSPD